MDRIRNLFAVAGVLVGAVLMGYGVGWRAVPVQVPQTAAAPAFAPAAQPATPSIPEFHLPGEETSPPVEAAPAPSEQAKSGAAPEQKYESVLLPERDVYLDIAGGGVTLAEGQIRRTYSGEKPPSLCPT